jgi:Cys-tRNA(Pro)/Cys-tRNA(Cys) deacylase
MPFPVHQSLGGSGGQDALPAEFNSGGQDTRPPEPPTGVVGGGILPASWAEARDSRTEKGTSHADSSSAAFADLLTSRLCDPKMPTAGVCARAELCRRCQSEPGLSMSDTNAVKWLRAQGVKFQVLTYAFTEVGADLAAAGVGRPLEACCKTLVVKAAGPSFHVAIIPGDQRFNTRKMAAAVGVKSADLADPAEAEKITGYHVGGISPFAMRRRLPTVIEESLLALDTILVNGGQRGVLVEMATQDVVRLLDARPADLCG